MLYKVIQYFGPGHVWWNDFAKDHWIQPLADFDSIDGILCPDLFTPQTDEDWKHCVTEDFKTSFLMDKEYAEKIWRSNPGSRLIGVIENANCDGDAGLLGYEVLDQFHSVSLITNWGPQDKDHPLSRFRAEPNGLFASYETATKAVEFLRRDAPISDHSPGSVWAIFRIEL